jgi:hypothetical protein
MDRSIRSESTNHLNTHTQTRTLPQTAVKSWTSGWCWPPRRSKRTGRPSRSWRGCRRCRLPWVKSVYGFIYMYVYIKHNNKPKKMKCVCCHYYMCAHQISHTYTNQHKNQNTNRRASRGQLPLLLAHGRHLCLFGGEAQRGGGQGWCVYIHVCVRLIRTHKNTKPKPKPTSHPTFNPLTHSPNQHTQKITIIKNQARSFRPSRRGTPSSLPLLPRPPCLGLISY